MTNSNKDQNMLDTIGKRLSYVREKKKISQSALGKEIGKNYQYVHRIELDEIKEPSPLLLARIAMALDVDLLWLVMGVHQVKSNEGGELLPDIELLRHMRMIADMYDMLKDTTGRLERLETVVDGLVAQNGKKKKL